MRVPSNFNSLAVNATDDGKCPRDASVRIELSGAGMRQRIAYMDVMSSNIGITEIGALMGIPARANMIAALMAGHALTATELARAASCRGRRRADTLRD